MAILIVQTSFRSQSHIAQAKMQLTIIVSDSISLKDNQSRQRLFEFGVESTVGYVIHSVIRQYHLPHSATNSLEEYGLALMYPIFSSTSPPASPLNSAGCSPFPTSFQPGRSVPLMDNTVWLEPGDTLASCVPDVCLLWIAQSACSCLSLSFSVCSVYCPRTRFLTVTLL